MQVWQLVKSLLNNSKDFCDLDEILTAQAVEKINNLHWKVEEFHRELNHPNGL